MNSSITTTSNETQILMCPISLREILITDNDFLIICDYFEFFVSCFFNLLNTGERNLNVVYRNVILQCKSHFIKLPDHYFPLIIHLHTCSLLICDHAYKTHEYNHIAFTRGLITPGYISECAFSNTPLFFRDYLRRIRSHNDNDSKYVHNCIVIKQIYDNFYCLTNFGTYLVPIIEDNVWAWSTAMFKLMIKQGLLPKYY